MADSTHLRPDCDPAKTPKLSRRGRKPICGCGGADCSDCRRAASKRRSYRRKHGSLDTTAADRATVLEVIERLGGFAVVMADPVTVPARSPHPFLVVANNPLYCGECGGGLLARVHETRLQ